MITLAVVSKVIPGKKKEFLQSVRTLTRELDKKGNLRSPTLYQEVKDRTVFNLVYELGTKEDLKKMLNTDEFKVLLGAFSVLCEKSKIRCKYNCRNRPRLAGTDEVY
jgi:hypothetical protein